MFGRLERPRHRQTDVPAVAERVVREVGPIVENLTNTESWWRSRVMLGSLTTIISSGIAVGVLINAGSTDAESYATLALAILGASFAIYGRLVAAKPLGK